MIMTRSYLQIILVALLLIAQHGAITHQIQHAQGQATGGSPQPLGSKDLLYSELCDFHLAFTQIPGAVGSTALSLCLAAPAVERSPNQFARFFPSDSVIPASRGPPIRL